MIAAVLFAPGPPWVVPGLAPALAEQQRPLRDAVTGAVDAVLADDLPVAVVAADGRRTASRWTDVLPPAPPSDGTATASGWGRSVAGCDPLPGPWLVGRTLLGDRPAAAALLGAAPGDVLAALDRWRRARERCGLLVIADGSHSHGEHAPGAPDDRAPALDDALAAALRDGRAGDPDVIGVLAGGRTDPAADPLGATLPRALAALAPLLEEEGPFSTAPLLPAPGWVAPYGVGHHLVAWRRAAG